MYKIYISLLFAHLLLASCTEKKGRHDNIFTAAEYTHIIKEVDSISFSLDSITSPYISGVEYIDNDSIIIFKYNNYLLMYNLEDRTMQSKVKIPSGNPTFFCYINKDSIFTNNYNSKSVILFDSTGNVKSTFPIKYPKTFMSFPVIKTSPVLFKQHKLYFSGNMAGEYLQENSDNRDVIMCYDLTNNTTKSTLSYSKIYQDYNWGGGLFRWVYSSFNNKDEIIVSLPADHNIYVTDLNFTHKKVFYSGSKTIQSTDYLKTPKVLPIDNDSQSKHFAESDSYANIFYDKYRDCYYRFAENRIKYDGSSGWKKGLNVIILDSEFNILGETQIKTYNPVYRYGSFITKKGLHIPYTTNDNELSYKIYQLCSK